MWELICHQSYCWGTIAADRSPWRSDGIPSGLGPVPDNPGALRFSGPHSQIAIPRRDTGPWRALPALRVEVTLRFRDPQHGILIEGDQSFRISVGAYGTLYGEVSGETINSVSHWTGSGPQGVVAGTWFRLTFVHNGFNRMHLLIDDALVATRAASTTVPGVGSQGVMIGHGIGTSSDYLDGDIESVRIWRLDPRAVEREFLARPLDPALSDCWTRFFRAIEEALRNHPDCAGWLIGVIENLHRKFLLALSQQSDATIEEFRKMCLEYRELWRTGFVGGSEMAALAVRFREFLRRERLFDPDDGELLQIAEHPCWEKLREHLPPLDCDPDVQTLLWALAGRVIGANKPERIESPRS
jgi:hypothetical protein